MKKKKREFNFTKFIKNLWKGKITLWKTFWGITIVLLIIFGPIEFLVSKDNYPVRAFLNILYLIFSVLSLICVWRSANNYNGRRVWYYLAKLTAIIDLMFSTLTAIQYGGLA